jgi:hypothetical protein
VPSRLLIINQYYWPGVEATANLLTDLAEDLATEFDVAVLTGELHGHEDLPRRDQRNGVQIVRVPRSSPSLLRAAFSTAVQTSSSA